MSGRPKYRKHIETYFRTRENDKKIGKNNKNKKTNRRKEDKSEKYRVPPICFLFFVFIVFFYFCFPLFSYLFLIFPRPKLCFYSFSVLGTARLKVNGYLEGIVWKSFPCKMRMKNLQNSKETRRNTRKIKETRLFVLFCLFAFLLCVFCMYIIYVFLLFGSFLNHRESKKYRFAGSTGTKNTVLQVPQFVFLYFSFVFVWTPAMLVHRMVGNRPPPALSLSSQDQAGPWSAA